MYLFNVNCGDIQQIVDVLFDDKFWRNDVVDGVRDFSDGVDNSFSTWNSFFDELKREFK